MKNRFRFSKLLLRFAAFVCGHPFHQSDGAAGEGALVEQRREWGPLTAFLELMSSLLPLDACAALLRDSLQES
jgi:hypothetical protein